MIENTESKTAQLCSFARAFHSGYEKQKIFDDYLAFDLLGKEQYEELGQLIENNFDLSKYNDTRYFCHKNIKDTLDKYIMPIPIARIAFAERELTSFAAKYGKIQYVILGAGMDSFAYRNENENIKIFEVDHPSTQGYKKERIKKLEWHTPKNLVYVSVDFEKDSLREKLLLNGFTKALPTFWAFLGVSYYLEINDFSETFRVISEMSSPKSMVCFDFPSQRWIKALSEEKDKRFAQLKELTGKLSEPIKFDYPLERIEKELARYNLAFSTLETPEDIQDKYFSAREKDLKAYDNVYFATARRANLVNKVNSVGGLRQK